MPARRTWVRLLRRLCIITVGAVVVLSLVGLLLGGAVGARNGAVLGIVCGVLGLPGMLLGLALNAGDEYADQTSRAFDRRHGSGAGD